MNKIAGSLLFCFLTVTIYAADLQVINSTLYYEGTEGNRTLYVIADLQWNYAWNNAKNHDAIWLFVKLQTGNNGYKHVLVSESGHELLINYLNKNQKIAFNKPTDRTGIMVHLDEPYRGNVSIRVRIQLDPKSLGNFNPYNGTLLVSGIEMVFVPSGVHYIGEPDSIMMKRYSSLYSPSTKKKYEIFPVSSENEIKIANEEGALYYQVETAAYQGDRQGPVPASFPKGFNGFYLMKYELTQGQYAAFLNTLSVEQSQLRVNFSGKDYYKNRGTISFQNGKYIAERPQRPCNYLSWDDAMAFADWAALRPYTELEFNKASLGSSKPKANQFPWGTTSRAQVERAVDASGDLLMLHGFSESQLTETNLETFGASYYWVMDLAGSVWERVITIGDPQGRSFKGSHGDGTISYYGFATNEDWPRGTKEEGGFGFRGGGFYSPGRPYHEFNAFSPVSYRPYGAWSGGNRSEAYGSRFARSADNK